MPAAAKYYTVVLEKCCLPISESAPLILSASSFYVQKAFGKEATLTIDLKPALSEEQLDKRLLRDIEENKGKQFKNVLSGLLPAKMQPVAVALSGINPDKKAGDITKEERKRLGQLLKNMPFTVTGCRDFAEAIITKGGVKVKEIQPSTMESQKGKRTVFCRRGAGLRRSYRRLQSADCLVHRVPCGTGGEGSITHGKEQPVKET